VDYYTTVYKSRDRLEFSGKEFSHFTSNRSPDCSCLSNPHEYGPGNGTVVDKTYGGGELQGASLGLLPQSVCCPSTDQLFAVHTVVRAIDLQATWILQGK
jgi:hypothetical protein